MNISLPANEILDIQSPNYPSFYADNEDCRWIIKAPQGHTLSLAMVDFVTEEDHDVFAFGTGSNSSDTSSVILSTSGVHEDQEWYLTSNQMWMTFRSDGDKVDRGFSLKIRDEGFQGTEVLPIYNGPTKHCNFLGMQCICFGERSVCPLKK